MQTLPIQLDLFALIIFLGVAQGLFLGVFFLTGSRGRQVANRCLGFFTLALSAVSGEIFLNYSNYTFRFLWTGDFAEPFNFVLGPLFYLYIFCRIRLRLPRYWQLHFIPFIIWSINSIAWLYQPKAVKYNAYINAQHPELPFVPQQPYWPDDFTGLRDYINEMTLLSCVVYALLALLTIRSINRSGEVGTKVVRLMPLRVLSWLFALVPFLIVLVKPQFQNDVGDYLLATYMAITIYTMSFLVMRDSDFFRDESPDKPQAELPLISAPDPKAEPKRKYEKSALPTEVEDALLNKLNQLVETEKPYLDSDLSLPKLAERLNTTPHHLSQLLNDRLEQNFFDWLASHRIAEAQILLNNPATINRKIEEIAERVGYNSTSAFHTAFKRITDLTPAQFRAMQLAKKVYRA